MIDSRSTHHQIATMPDKRKIGITRTPRPDINHGDYAKVQPRLKSVPKP